ncbi:MAG: PqqD family protein [Clostridia bacterium]|nr:PqqD family protein [Clostridia bacterium]
MKLKDGFITREMAEKQIMVSVNGDFSGLVRSNQTAAFIVDNLKEETTKEEIVKKLLEKYDAKEDIITEDVENVLETLRKIGALDE